VKLEALGKDALSRRRRRAAEGRGPAILGKTQEEEK
jgi:hypothetical protein